MAKAPRKIRASARALENQRAKRFQPLLDIKHKPYRVWAAPKNHQVNTLACFVEQAELADGDYVPMEQAAWIGFGEPQMTEELAIKLALNPRIHCAGPYCLIHYPLDI